MRSLSFVFIVAVSCLFTSSAAAQSDSLLKTNDIRVLLNLMEVGPSMQRSVVSEIAIGRASNEPGLPEKFWDEFEKEALSSVSSFLERLIPVYDSTFSHVEIKSLIETYQRPVMRKLNASYAPLEAAANKAGVAWGEEMGLRVAMRLDNGAPTEEVRQNESVAPKDKK